MFAASEAPPEISDEELVARYQEGRDPSDFEQLVRRYERELYTFLRRFWEMPSMPKMFFRGPS